MPGKGGGVLLEMEHPWAKASLAKDPGTHVAPRRAPEH